MEGETIIAATVLDLRRVVAEENIQAAVGDNRADRMDVRPTVLPARNQRAEPDTELGDERLPRLGCVGLFGRTRRLEMSA